MKPPRFDTRRVSAACSALAAATVLSACHRTAAKDVAPAEAPPPNEVQLPKEQLVAAQISLGKVESRPLGSSIAASGRITFDDLRVAHVFSPVTGRVGEIRASLGQRVQKGDLLTSIVSPDVGQASSDLAKAEADVIAAEHDFKRKQELLASNAASAADVEASEDNFRKSKAERERALQKVKLLHAGSTTTQGYPLTSPIAGEVIARAVNPGVEVQGQYGGGGQVTELFTIGELDSVWLLVDVFEMDLPRVHVGSKVSASVIAFPDRTFEGKVDWLSGSIDPTMRTAKIRCVLPNADRDLRPEMFATATIDVDSSEEPSVPRTAAMHLGKEFFIWVQNGTTADGRLRFMKTKVEADDTAGTPWLPIHNGPAVGTPIVATGGIILLGML